MARTTGFVPLVLFVPVLLAAGCTSLGERRLRYHDEYDAQGPATKVFRGARVFLFDEPTRGIDVGAKVEVFELMDRLARDGAAVVMVSSEMQELPQVADRILVMRQGRIAGELPGRATQEQIMRYAVGEQVQ